jgi:hypothetical protein
MYYTYNIGVAFVVLYFCVVLLKCIVVVLRCAAIYWESDHFEITKCDAAE